LIFGWYPWGGSAQQIESRGYFGLESVIDGQAILVAPEGRDFRDNGLGWGMKACSPTQRLFDDRYHAAAELCDGLGANNERCSCVEYPGCKAGYPVISCEYKAGHQFAPNAGATLWDFFSQF
jgi:hypothetical protein